MFQPIKIAILDAVPRVYWSDDEGITDAQKFVDLLAPENPQARLAHMGEMDDAVFCFLSKWGI